MEKKNWTKEQREAYKSLKEKYKNSPQDLKIVEQSIKDGDDPIRLRDLHEMF